MGWITWRLYSIYYRNDNSVSGSVYYEPDTGLPYTYECIRKKVYLHVKGGVPAPAEEEAVQTEEAPVQDSHPVPALPQRFSQFATIDGNHLWPYIEIVDRKYSRLDDTISLILKHFPTWESVKNSDSWAKHGVTSGWDETKHNLFKECLEWCNEQGRFYSEWGY